MNQSTARATEAVPVPSKEPVVAVPPQKAATPPRRRRHPWIVVLTVVVVAWLGLFVVPTYITLNPDRAGITLLRSFPLHYPVLIVHVVTGLLAMITGCLQMFPRLRQR